MKPAPGIAKVLAVERDVKPLNMSFAKVQRRGAINREGAFIWINTVHIPGPFLQIVFLFIVTL